MASCTSGWPLGALAGIRGRNQSRSFDCALVRFPSPSGFGGAMCGTIMTNGGKHEIVRLANEDASVRVPPSGRSRLVINGRIIKAAVQTKYVKALREQRCLSSKSH